MIIQVWIVALAAFAAAAQDGKLERARAALQDAAPPGYVSPHALQEAVKAGALETLGPEDASQLLDASLIVERDVEYSRAGEVVLALDVYRPAATQAPVPALVFIHGGGWETKGKEFYTYWCARYARMGYVCASVEYRTSDEAAFPAAVQDVNCAIRWMRANATNYNVDPYKIGIIGQSAGAHLALMAAYADAIEGDCALGGVNGKVQAVVEYYGPVDLTLRPMYTKDVVQKFVGATFGEAPERYVQASPITHVDPSDPPTLIFHGTIDGVVGIAQADILAETLEAAGVPYVYDRIEGWDHGLEIFKAVNEHCMRVQDVFLATYLPLPPAPRSELPAEATPIEGAVGE